MWFTKKGMIAGISGLVVLYLILFPVYKEGAVKDAGPMAMAILAPFQKAVTSSMRMVNDTWRHYFFLIATARENDRLKEALRAAKAQTHLTNEVQIANTRLGRLLDFKGHVENRTVAAEVIGKDPSPWFKTLIIDKGATHGINVGAPVIVPEGVAGIVTERSSHFSKILLIIDQNSAVDALVQRTRATGIVKGTSETTCRLDYVLRKHEIVKGDIAVTSGLDGIFPKGLPIGRISNVYKGKAGIFQEVELIPFVDFERIEEVLVIISPVRAESLDMP